MMKTIILMFLLLATTLLTGCAKQPALNSSPTLVYTEEDNYKSKRVDYLGYGLGGHGFGGYSMGGYGLVGYAGQMPE